MNKILIADDEPDVLEFLKYNLSKNNFNVLTAKSGEETIYKATTEHPDLIMLDIMMPGIDGIETCKELRSNEKIGHPLIVLFSGRNDDYTQIAGLSSGADSFIAKPIRPNLLTSRLNALLRRQRITKATNLSVNGISLNEEDYSMTYDAHTAILPRKEFLLLQLLMSKPGHVFTREGIMSAVWDNAIDISDRTIDVHIRKLRERIGNNKIATLNGIGYRLNV